jgi:hypothetical protein
MILPPKAESLFSNAGQPRHLIPKIYRHGDVLDVQALDMNFAFWSNFPKDGQPAKGDGVQVVIVDPIRGAVTLPSDFSDDLIQALQQPYSRGKSGAGAPPAVPLSAFATIANGKVDIEGGVIEIAARRFGVIKDVLVHEGDLVKKGQVLARQEDQDTTLAIDSARAALTQTQSQLVLAQGAGASTLNVSTMFDLEPVLPHIIRAEIVESAVPDVHVGQHAQIVPEADPGRVSTGKVIRIAATFGARKLKSDAANEASDERIVEVVVSADDAPFLIGQRVLVKFMKPGQPVQ